MVSITWLAGLMGVFACRMSVPLEGGAEQGFFRHVRSDSTVFIERVLRSDEFVEGVLGTEPIATKSSGEPKRIRYRAELDKKALVRSVEFSVWGEADAPSDPPVRICTLKFEDDEVLVVDCDRGRSFVERIPTPHGTMPWLASCQGLLEQILLRARAMDSPGGRRDVPVLAFRDGARPKTMTVEWIGSDSVAVSFEGRESRYAVDRDARLLGGHGTDGESWTLRMPAESVD